MLQALEPGDFAFEHGIPLEALTLRAVPQARSAWDVALEWLGPHADTASRPGAAAIALMGDSILASSPPPPIDAPQTEVDPEQAASSIQRLYRGHASRTLAAWLPEASAASGDAAGGAASAAGGAASAADGAGAAVPPAKRRLSDGPGETVTWNDDDELF